MMMHNWWKIDGGMGMGFGWLFMLLRLVYAFFGFTTAIPKVAEGSLITSAAAETLEFRP